MNWRPVRTGLSLAMTNKLARDEADPSKELINKSENFAKYQHEKHAAPAQLQSSYDAL